jgi:hypothetical protein
VIHYLLAVQAAIDHARILADPTPAPAIPPVINTSGILTFFASKIAPILLGFLGVMFIARAKNGEVNRVVTSSGISIVGLAFLAGAATLLVVGGDLVKLVVGG